MSAPVWLITGLSAAGKSTLAKRLTRRCHAVLLDADRERRRWPHLGFNATDRMRNLRRLAARAAAFPHHIVIVTAIAPRRADRRSFVQRLWPRAVRLIYLNTPLALCRSRDRRGLYAGAASGTVIGLPGVDVPYVAPGKSAAFLPGRCSRLAVAAQAERMLRRMSLGAGGTVAAARTTRLHLR